MEIRLSKLMAERGLCSRREADRYIEQGKVTVNGETITQLGTKVSPDAEIELKRSGQPITILLNKPLGYVSAQPEDGHEPAIVLLTKERRHDRGRPLNPRKLEKLAVAGRLDINSSGLLVFTQDGRIARQLVGEGSAVEKEYIVRVEGEITPQKLEKLRYGLELDDRPLRQAKVERLGESRLRIILQEGRKRQIRRMCELVQLKVVSLKRIRVGNVSLGKLPPGSWRLLHPAESF